VRAFRSKTIAQETSANTLRLFSKMPPPRPGCGGRVSLAFTILGCGSSGGVPRIGQVGRLVIQQIPKNRPPPLLAVCRSVPAKTEPRPKSRRHGAGSPRTIAWNRDRKARRHTADPRARDHIHGIDDIRPLVILARRKIDLYMDAATAAIVRGTSVIFSKRLRVANILPY